jgi:hypothetical protein
MFKVVNLDRHDGEVVPTAADPACIVAGSPWIQKACKMADFDPISDMACGAR